MVDHGASPNGTLFGKSVEKIRPGMDLRKVQVLHRSVQRLQFLEELNYPLAIAGMVKVYLDGTEIASAGPELHKTIAFDFNAGAVLSIHDEGANSVIQISKFKILKCGRCIPKLLFLVTYIYT